MTDDAILFAKTCKHDNPVPSRGTEHAEGYDLRAIEGVAIPPGERALVKTGWSMQLPEENFYAMVCPRSGLAIKHGITVLNAPGIVDYDYRGDIGVILINHGTQTFFVSPGDRIAQLVIGISVSRGLEFGAREVESLEDTERGNGGFGSTGVA